VKNERQPNLFQLEKESLMIPAGYSRYAQAATTVEKKEDILLMLLDAASMDLKKIRMGIEDNNPKLKGESVSRAIGILTELDCALDHEAAREMSENLSGLYHFIIDRLTFANLKKDLSALNDAEQVLTQLHDGFKQAVKIRKEKHSADPVGSFDDGRESENYMSRKLSIAV
jgi:flagellar protein FliS